MDHSSPDRELKTRIETYNQFKDLFASAPIRLMSRVVSAMQAQGFDDQATAIGDMDWRTVPAGDSEDPGLREEWGRLLDWAFDHAAAWMRQLSSHPLGYNLDSVGYPALIQAWSRVWHTQVGLDFANRRGAIPEIFLFHGGNQAVQAALLGVAEAHRERHTTARPATILVPLPTFSCPLDQIALQGMQVVFLPPSGADMDPRAEDLRLIPDGVDIDGLYMMPVNNPTGRTLPPGQMRDFVAAVLDRWPDAGIILDSVYVRLHPRHDQLLRWYLDDPRFADHVMFIDSLSKTHGVTGLRSGAVMTKASSLANGVVRYAQNVMAGPSNMMQAVSLALLSPYLAGDEELEEHAIDLQLRIGRHLQSRRRLHLERIFDRYRDLVDTEQPLLPDPLGFDWEGSMYAVVRLSDRCFEAAREYGVSPTVAFYFETGIGGVPLAGFCGNPNLDRHGLVLNGDDPTLDSFRREAERFVRLSFGMVAPPQKHGE
ncbi:MAG: pyridoxal phosphate-dependent aminotransferase [Acidobacteria bacterium]|nr:pyridoxal phosphate-dependent aminotransferase [Acidobacteriota bacterium]